MTGGSSGRDERKLLHDLNAALQVVTGNLELLEPCCVADADSHAMVHAALGGARDAVLLVRELQQQVREDAQAIARG